jgi:deazaflavin-dependent oxidoreductase (nitroreductase family)
MTTLSNRLVGYLLRSPLHSLLSGSTCLIRYNGRRTGRQITTPTQYVRHGDQLVILVARHEDKTWWRNFTIEGDIEILLRRRWVSMTARAVVGSDEPDTVAPLLDAYLRRFPKVSRRVGVEGDNSPAKGVVMVRGQPPTTADLNLKASDERSAMSQSPTPAPT